MDDEEAAIALREAALTRLFEDGVAFALYGALASAAAPFFSAERRGEAHADAWNESAKGAWLVHAVSVGEVKAAGAFLDALAAARPSARVLLTTGNRDGLAAAERLRTSCRAVDAVGMLPFDRPDSLRAWLRRLDPAAVVVVETEIWPGLFLVARRLGVPLFVVSGRMSEGDARRYGLLRPFFRRVLSAAEGIAVQSEADRRRFLRAGAPADRVELLGNLKFDAAETPAETHRESDEPLVVAGSTHEPEERHLVEAFTALRPRFPRVRLVLAPRHPERAARIAAEARRRGLRVALHSEERVNAEVVVVDRFGVLAGLYARATIAFVGGSLVPHGGQSPIEPAAHGVPIVMGPSDESFREMSKRLEEAGALVRVNGGDAAAGLLTAFADLLSDDARREERGRAAQRVFAEGRGAARATVDWVLERVEARREKKSGRMEG